MNETNFDTVTNVEGFNETDVVPDDSMVLDTENNSVDVNNYEDSTTNDFVNRLIKIGVTTIFGFGIAWVIKHRKQLVIKWLDYRIKKTAKAKNKETEKLEELKTAYEKYLAETKEKEEGKEN